MGDPSSMAVRAFTLSTSGAERESQRIQVENFQAAAQALSEALGGDCQQVNVSDFDDYLDNNSLDFDGASSKMHK